MRLDDIDEMRRQADAYTVQAAELRQIAETQPSRSTTHSMTTNACRLAQFVREYFEGQLNGRSARPGPLIVTPLTGDRTA